MPHAQLRHLELDGHYVGAEGAKCLSEDLGHVPPLQQLKLGSNEIDDESRSLFATFPSLTVQL